jgi:hypothetical protein
MRTAKSIQCEISQWTLAMPQNGVIERVEACGIAALIAGHCTALACGVAMAMPQCWRLARTAAMRTLAPLGNDPTAAIAHRSLHGARWHCALNARAYSARVDSH